MFFWKYIQNFQYYLKPLQVQMHTFSLEDKRTSHSASEKYDDRSGKARPLFSSDTERLISEEGSVTVEAAILIPLLLCGCMALILWQQVFLVHQEIETALLETARQVAKQELYLEGDMEGTGILSAALLFQNNRQQGKDRYGVGVSAVNLLHSEYRQESREVYLEARYHITIPLFFLGTWKLPIKTSVIQKAWNGCSGNWGVWSSSGDYVYVTEYGTVYHKNSGCYHLQVHVEPTEDVMSYYEGETSLRSCLFCVEEGTRKEVLYIPEEGECYHENPSCSGLTRTIYYKKMEDTAGRSPCRDCYP